MQCMKDCMMTPTAHPCQMLLPAANKCYLSLFVRRLGMNLIMNTETLEHCCM